MTALDIGRARAALAPLIAELLRRATADAEQAMADARSAVLAASARAEAEVQVIEASARTAGAARATAALAAERARRRRADRREILAVQRAAYRQLRAEAIRAVQRSGAESDYPSLRDTLHAVAGELLGADAVITDDPDGGIVAVAAGRLVDLRLSTIAVRAFERAEPGLGELWA